MSRPVRLAIGILLLAIAAVFFLMREGAVNTKVVWVFVSLFAIPGLVLLALGIVPRRGMPAQTVMAFKPTPLVVGLLLSAGGAIIVGVHQLIYLPHMLMIGALIAVPGGLILAGTCWSESCARCLAPLEDKRIAFNAESEAVKAAINARSVMKLLELHSQTSGAVPAHLRYCPKCRKVALLSGPHNATAVLADDLAVRFLKQTV
jgi:hypothetical protein